MSASIDSIVCGPMDSIVDKSIGSNRDVSIEPIGDGSTMVLWLMDSRPLLATVQCARAV